MIYKCSLFFRDKLTNIKLASKKVSIVMGEDSMCGSWS